jgi:hypothetical protein
MAPSFKAIATSVQGTAGSSAAKSAAASAAAKEAAQSAAKAGAASAAGVAAKEAAQASTKAAASVAAKEGANVAAKEAAQAAVKEASTKGLKESLKETAQSVGKSAKDIVSKNPGKAILGLTGAALATALAVNYQKSASTPRGITKIEKEKGELFGDENIVRITFDPNIRITKNDLITFKGTKTKPSLDAVDVEVYDVISDAVILYKPKEPLTTFLPGGEISVKTSAMAQFGDMAGQQLENAGGAAGNVAEGGSDALSKFFKNLSFKTMGGIFVVIVIIVIFVVMSRR